MDLFEPSGHGRRRKREVNAEAKTKEIASKGNTTVHSAKFQENIEYTVLMPGGKYPNPMHRKFINTREIKYIHDSDENISHLSKVAHSP